MKIGNDQTVVLEDTFAAWWLRRINIGGVVLGRLFRARGSGPVHLSEEEKDTINSERAEFAAAACQTLSDDQACRAALLKAGGAQLDHQPGYEDGWETAIRRLLQQGELRELIQYASFPQTRTYQYVLTPAGERAAAELEAG